MGGNLAVDFLNAIADSDDEETRGTTMSQHKASSVISGDRYTPYKLRSFGSVPSEQIPMCSAEGEDSERESRKSSQHGEGRDDIDLASIRAVYKEGITSSKSLDEVLASHGKSLPCICP